jgi:hypothetical protein
MRNETIRGKLGVANVAEDTEKYKRQWTAHVVRMENNRLLKKGKIMQCSGRIHVARPERKRVDQQ